MNTPRMSALAYLYDNLPDLPAWFRRLTPKQIEEIANIMAKWETPSNGSILPLEEIERREVLRAIRLFRGNVVEAARALNIGKTTVYRKLNRWGYTVHNRVLQAQASVLAGNTDPRSEHYW